MMTRRNLLTGCTMLAAGALASRAFAAKDVATGTFEVTRSEAEWRAALSEDQFQVLRKAATERAFTSQLNEEKRAGLFTCAGCDQPVYSSEVKYDSGTGWPSFWEALPDAVGTSRDTSMFMVRTECHCSRCGGHLGHIFDDGPEPTGKRHCINGIAMNFTPGAAYPA